MSKRIALIVSDFNDDITGRMEATALTAAQEAGAQVVKIIHVPGAYDMPVVAARLAARSDVDAIATLGAVIKGDTKHDEIVCEQCARGLMEISLRTGKPVTLGVIGPGTTHPQALGRADEYARRAVEVALQLLDSLHEAEQKE